MQTRTHFKRRLGVSALIASASAMSVAFVFSGPSYYARPGIPDFDQQREWLPRQGAMYCVPTSYADVMKYMAANGLPSMDSAYGNSYDSVTSFINYLGQKVETDSVEGTDPEVAYDVMSEWVVEHSNVIMLNSFYGPDWNWGINTIRNVIAAGSVGTLGYGRYYHIGDSWVRSGGHANALGGYDFRTASKYLLVLDPNSTYNDTAGLEGQGTYQYDKKITDNLTLTTEDYGVRTHARYGIAVASSGGAPAMRRFIDHLHTIVPCWAGWLETSVIASTDEGSAGDGSVKTLMPFQLGEQQFTPAEVTPREEVVDWVYDIGAAAMFYVTKLGRIYYVDLTTGDDKLIHVVKGATALMVGGTTNDLFVLVKGDPNDTVMCFERDDMHLEQDTVPDRIRSSSKALPGHGIAMEFDPISGGPAVLKSDLSLAWTFGETLAPSDDLTVPPIGPGTGRVIFKIDHLSGNVFMARQGDMAYWRVQRRGETVRQSVRLTVGIQTIVPTEGHRLLIQDGDVLQTFDSGGNPTQTQFSDVVVGGLVKLPRSSFAGKRGAMTGPKWRNLNPSELID